MQPGLGGDSAAANADKARSPVVSNAANIAASSALSVDEKPSTSQDSTTCARSLSCVINNVDAPAVHLILVVQVKGNFQSFFRTVSPLKDLHEPTCFVVVLAATGCQRQNAGNPAYILQAA